MVDPSAFQWPSLFGLRLLAHPRREALAMVAELVHVLRFTHPVEHPSMHAAWVKGKAFLERQRPEPAATIREDLYTRAELDAALDGIRVTTTDAVTDDVIAKVSEWLMARSRELAPHDAADELETAALDMRDGEWRRERGPRGESPSASTLANLNLIGATGNARDPYLSPEEEAVLDEMLAKSKEPKPALAVDGPPPRESTLLPQDLPGAKPPPRLSIRFRLREVAKGKLDPDREAKAMGEQISALVEWARQAGPVRIPGTTDDERSSWARVLAADVFKVLFAWSMTWETGFREQVTKAIDMRLLQFRAEAQAAATSSAGSSVATCLWKGKTCDEPCHLPLGHDGDHSFEALVRLRLAVRALIEYEWGDPAKGNVIPEHQDIWLRVQDAAAPSSSKGQP